MSERDRRLLLDRLAADAWPAIEVVELRGWRLRAAEGVTRRANSALPLDAAPTDDALDEQLAAVAGFYADRGLPARIQVSDPRLDAELAARGWQLESPTLVLSGPLPGARPASYRAGSPPCGGLLVNTSGVLTSGSPQGRSSSAPPAAAEVTPIPDEAWLDCWWAVSARGGRRELEVARRCLAGITAPVGYASVRLDDRVVAVGRGVAQEGWLGLFAMAVLPTSRRQGHGRHLMGALGRWAATHGACAAYLQLWSGNDPARALYTAAGFTTAYPYHYRYRPSP